MHALRRQSKVTNHWNLGLRQRLHQRHARPFDLHGFRACFFNEAHRVGHTLRHRAVVAAERHIRHHQCPAHSSPHSTRVMQHLVDGHS